MRAPLHLACDCKGAVTRIARLLRQGAFEKPFSLTRDGDVWQAIAELVQQRGASSIAIKHIPSHCVRAD
eukprot:3584856-Alexandrium_andersonii.AAC.1